MPRGRKPKAKVNKIYFDQEQEKAVIRFLQEEDQQIKDKIYNEELLPAFTKMTESIIRRYKLYVPDECFDETFNDALSFLATKIHYFNPESNFKAYSYCGTIIKNYLIYKINIYNKNLKRSTTVDISQCNSDDETYIDDSYTEYGTSFFDELIKRTIAEIEKTLVAKHKKPLSTDEIIVGNALINLLKNWENLFNDMGSNKFNKSSVLLFLKENTNMSTQDIRKNMKKFKYVYFLIKEKLLE